MADQKDISENDDGSTADRLARYRVTSGKHFKLDDYPTDEVWPGKLEKAAGVALLQDRVARLAKLQEQFFIAKPAAILVLFQAMDCGGKDSTIRNVTAGVHPAGLVVTSFKTPTPEENAHDFLWRISQALPARGMIGVFNRSHYESVLISRVHPQVLAKEGLGASITEKHGFWDKRLEDIAAFEQHLAREGTRIVKIFLHISRGEQKKRLLSRLDEADKNWKFDPSDVAERAHWKEYIDAYEKAIGATASSKTPWYVVPGDRHWYARLVAAEAILEAFDGLDLDTPKLTKEQRAAMDQARRALEEE